MWPFDGWRQARAERERLEELRISEELMQVKQTAIDDLEKEVVVMTTTFCSIRNTVCTKDCIHFYKGVANAFYHPASEYYPEFNRVYHSPKCKLWHE